jgi:hypothetical protein
MAMDQPTEARIWNQKVSDSLDGACHRIAGQNWAVRTEDGSLWLLEAEAENLLVGLHPAEGQVVHVRYKHERFRRPTYDVTLP